MQNANVRIVSLLNKEPDILSEHYFFTSYLPTRNYYKKDIKKRIKSQVFTTFKNSKLAKSNTHHHLLENIYKEIESNANVKKGIAIFAKISKVNNIKSKSENGNYLNVLFLDSEPEKHSNLGTKFDIDQLVWALDASTNSYVINLQRKICNIYKHENGSLSLVKQITNEFIKEKESEYLEVFSPTIVKETHYTTGSNKVSRIEEQENLDFINIIADQVKDILKMDSPNNYIINFYSPYYDEIIENLLEEVNLKYPQSNIISEEYNETDANVLKEKSEMIINQARIETKKNLFESAKSDYRHFASDWNEVTKADRENRIDTLFIKPGSRKPGYLLSDKFIYTYPEKDTSKVDDISACLLRNVINSNGKIVVIKTESTMPDVEVAASLRY